MTTATIKSRPLLRALGKQWNSNPITEKEVLDISICEHLALAGWRVDPGLTDDWRVLRDAAAVTFTMAAGGAGPEALAVARQALDMLGNRYSITNDPLSDDEVKVIAEMLAYHDAQRRAMPRITLLNWLVKTEKAMAA